MYQTTSHKKLSYPIHHFQHNKVLYRTEMVQEQHEMLWNASRNPTNVKKYTKGTGQHALAESIVVRKAIWEFLKALTIDASINLILISDTQGTRNQINDLFIYSTSHCPHWDSEKKHKLISIITHSNSCN